MATELDDALAGRLVEAWVKSAIARWMNRLPRRDRRFDEQVCLLTWDMLCAALAYTEWDDLAMLLSGDVKATNVFTMTLNHRLRQVPQLQAHIAVILHRASSLVGAADELKAWFEALLAEWIDKVAIGQQGGMPVAMVFNGLIHNAYDLVVWEHVARAFRPDY